MAPAHFLARCSTFAAVFWTSCILKMINAALRDVVGAGHDSGNTNDVGGEIRNFTAGTTTTLADAGGGDEGDVATTSAEPTRAPRPPAEPKGPKEPKNSRPLFAENRPWWAEEVLARHNEYRCMHGVPPLVWSMDLEAHAKQWAILGRGQRSPPFQLTNVGPFAQVGENLATGVTDQGGMKSPGGQVMGWYGEIEHTPDGRGLVLDYSYDTFHYTNIVWRSTTSVGCAWLLNDLFLCQYGPAGSISGQFAAEVPEHKRPYQECRSWY